MLSRLGPEGHVGVGYGAAEEDKDSAPGCEPRWRGRRTPGDQKLESGYPLLLLLPLRGGLMGAAGDHAAGRYVPGARICEEEHCDQMCPNVAALVMTRPAAAQAATYAALASVAMQCVLLTRDSVIALQCPRLLLGQRLCFLPSPLLSGTP